MIGSLVLDNNSTPVLCKKYEVDLNIWFISKLMQFIGTDTYNIHEYSYNTNTYYTTKYVSLDIKPDDEYDSENEEMGGPNMMKLLKETDYKYAGYDLDEATKFAHAKHNFFYAVNKELFLINDKILRHMTKFIDYTKKAVKREGECFILKTDEVVWDFHKHTLDKGISEEGLEAYLTSIMSDPDKRNIKCYVPDCTESLKEYEVRPLLNKEFWERFSLPTNISSKINTSTMDMILTNTESTTNGWGNVYHHTLCPFCIAQEVREEGCGYMTHKVSTKLSGPFCENYNLIKEIKDKYQPLCKNNKLQFCVTCGRPCCNHKHFNLNLENPKLIKTVVVAGEDPYTKCMGGGRPELFARLLAIQKVISEQEFENDIEQRKACALAALKAPLDPELMTRGQAIFDKDPEARGLANIGINPLESNQEGGNKNIVSFD
jgi:hypothetical protein